MCGRFVQIPIRDAASLGFPKLANDLLAMPASYNLAPTQRASIVLDRGEGLKVQPLAWGLLPVWATAKCLQGSTINARIETVATQPAFRGAFRARRCLIPMAGYYEWSVNPDDKQKDPWFIHAKTPLWAAGLWEDASRLLDDANLGTFTVITGDNSSVSADVHDRMPVWLAPGQAEEWIKADAEGAMAMLLASEQPAMEAYRVGRAVNSPRIDCEALLDPV